MLGIWLLAARLRCHASSGILAIRRNRTRCGFCWLRQGRAAWRGQFDGGAVSAGATAEGVGRGAAADSYFGGHHGGRDLSAACRVAVYLPVAAVDAGRNCDWLLGV